MSIKLIQALRQVLGAELKRSGNILHLLRSVDEEIAVKTADTYYKKKAKEDEVFQKALTFALENKNKNSFYRMVLNNHVLYFVGSESEVVNRIKDKLDEMQPKIQKLEI